MKFQRKPGVLGLEAWGARVGKWSFFMTQDVSGDGAWRASWANDDPATIPPGGRRLTTWIIGPEFAAPLRRDAEAACEATLRQLRGSS